MADFCKQCSIELFGKDLKELAGLVSKPDSKAGYGAVVLCEGCGGTMVDHKGKCLGHCGKASHRFASLAEQRRVEAFRKAKNNA